LRKIRPKTKIRGEPIKTRTDCCPQGVAGPLRLVDSNRKRDRGGGVKEGRRIEQEGGVTAITKKHRRKKKRKSLRNSPKREYEKSANKGN